jgi:hypothetical protein
MSQLNVFQFLGNDANFFGNFRECFVSIRPLLYRATISW